MPEATHRPYERRSFDAEACTACGICLQQCPVMALPPDKARGEMERLLAGEDSPVLRACTSCGACNLYCPEDCRPANLILDRWHADYIKHGLPVRAAYFLPHSRPNFRTDIVARLPTEEREVVRAWRWAADDPTDRPARAFLFSGCNLVTAPYLTFSRAFEGTDIRGGLDYCCGEMLFRMGLYEPLADVARRMAHWLTALRAERVYLLCTAGLHMLRHVLPQFTDSQYPMPNVEFLPYLQVILERLEAGDLGPVRPLGLTVSVQDSCHARFLPAPGGGEEFADLPRRLLSAIGVGVEEAPHSRDRGLCCGIAGGFSHRSAYHPADLLLSARATSRDQRRAPAEATCVYCAGCLEMMSVARLPDPNRRPVYHLLELVQMALGEAPRRRQGALAQGFVAGTVRRQFPRLVSRRRFWLPPLPVEPDPEEAV
jgi:Fe-S oxidoreductase